MRILLGLFLLSVLLFGTELVLDREYTGPKKLTVSQLGVSMGVPPRWKAIARQGEGLHLRQPDTNDTMTLRSKSLNLSDALEYLNQPHYTPEGVKLFPQGGLVKLSSRIFQRRYVANGVQKQLAFLFYVVLGPQERAVVMKVKYNKSNESAIKAISMNVVQALYFTPTKQLKSALQNLTMRLKGAHVAYMKRDGAYDDKQELWLCSNGEYMLQQEQVVSGGMSRIKVQKTGNWSVDDSQLILRESNGLEQVIEVELQDNALLLEGYRSYELANHQCK